MSCMFIYRSQSTVHMKQDVLYSINTFSFIRQLQLLINQLVYIDHIASIKNTLQCQIIYVQTKMCLSDSVLIVSIDVNIK